jgi:hypothetical protein
MVDYEQLLMLVPSNVSFGYSSVSLCHPSELQKRQVGYSVHPDGTSLCGDEDGDWRSNWLVIGDEGECGDPIFIDTAAPGYPVYRMARRRPMGSEANRRIAKWAARSSRCCCQGGERKRKPHRTRTVPHHGNRTENRFGRNSAA